MCKRLEIILKYQNKKGRNEPFLFSQLTRNWKMKRIRNENCVSSMRSTVHEWKKKSQHRFLLEIINNSNRVVVHFILFEQNFLFFIFGGGKKTTCTVEYRYILIIIYMKRMKNNFAKQNWNIYNLLVLVLKKRRESTFCYKCFRFVRLFLFVIE